MVVHTCPRCKHDGQFKRFGGKRPGWECPHCGIFFPADTWMIKDGTIVRKYTKPPKRSTYINRDAFASVPTGKVIAPDEYEFLDLDRVESGLPNLSDW